jgi:protein phosphatase
VITQSLGVSEIDGVIVDTINNEWHAGEKILLCSDGLTDLLSDDEISNIFRKHRNKNNQELVDILIESALSKGGIDNVSVQVISAPDLTKLSSGNALGRHVHKLALAVVTVTLFTAYFWLFKKQ